MPLLVFEFLGTTEMLVIALVALIIFGPRKLPELGRSLGKSIGEFRRASEDFKRTWEREVEVERVERELRIEREVDAALSASPAAASAPSALSVGGAGTAPSDVSTEESAVGAPGERHVGGEQAAETEQTIARTSSREAPSQSEMADAPAGGPAAQAETVRPAGKQDWL